MKASDTTTNGKPVTGLTGDAVRTNIAGNWQGEYEEFPKMTMEKALRIVDAIGEHPVTATDAWDIYARVTELVRSDPKIRPSEASRQARAEFVLRVANEGGRE